MKAAIIAVGILIGRSKLVCSGAIGVGVGVGLWNPKCGFLEEFQGLEAVVCDVHNAILLAELLDHDLLIDVVVLHE